MNLLNPQNNNIQERNIVIAFRNGTTAFHMDQLIEL